MNRPMLAVVLALTFFAVGGGIFAAKMMTVGSDQHDKAVANALKAADLPSNPNQFETTSTSRGVAMFVTVRNDRVFTVICGQDKSPSPQQIAGGMCDERSPALQSHRYKLER